MKRKVGDKVRIKSLEWYEENKEYGDIDPIRGPFAMNSKMAEYCGKDAEIKTVVANSYRIDIDGGLWNWSDEMFEDEPVERTEASDINSEMLEALHKIASRGRGVIRLIAKEAIKKATQP